MSTIRHPGDAEAAAAIAGLHQQTPSPRVFRAGQTVRVPRAFSAGFQVGTVVDRVTERHLGVCYRVDTQEGRLLLLADEIEVI